MVVVDSRPVQDKDNPPLSRQQFGEARPGLSAPSPRPAPACAGLSREANWSDRPRQAIVARAAATSRPPSPRPGERAGMRGPERQVFSRDVNL